MLTCLPLMFALELRAWVVIKRSIWHCIGIVPTMANTFLTSPLRSCPVHVLYCMQPNLHGNGSAVLTSDTSRPCAGRHSFHYITFFYSAPPLIRSWTRHTYPVCTFPGPVPLTSSFTSTSLPSSSLYFWRQIRPMPPWVVLHTYAVCVFPGPVLLTSSFTSTYQPSSALIAHSLATDSPCDSLGCRGAVGSAYSAAPLQESAPRATALSLILVYRA